MNELFVTRLRECMAVVIDSDQLGDETLFVDEDGITVMVVMQDPRRPEHATVTFCLHNNEQWDVDRGEVQQGNFQTTSAMAEG